MDARVGASLGRDDAARLLTLTDSGALDARQQTLTKEFDGVVPSLLGVCAEQHTLACSTWLTIMPFENAM